MPAFLFADADIVEAVTAVVTETSELCLVEVAKRLGMTKAGLNHRLRTEELIQSVEAASEQAGRLLRARYQDETRPRYVVLTPEDAANADFYGPAPLPDAPTNAVPGSLKKLRVMAERARLRTQLHHPDDYRDKDSLRGHKFRLLIHARQYPKSE